MKTLTERQAGWCELTWKRFYFAVGHHLYRELKRRCKKHYTDQLYECAKHHAGCKSLVFPPRAGTLREQRREDGTARWARLLLTQSLENYELAYRLPAEMFRNVWMSYSHELKTLVHEGRLEQYADEVEFKHTAVEAHDADTISMAQAYHTDGDAGRLPIIADGLLDCGDEAGADHLRIGLHTPACIVIQGILRRSS